MIRKRLVDISQSNVVPGYSANGKVIVSSCMGLLYPEAELAINVPINRLRDGARRHCKVVTSLNHEDDKVVATLIESDSPDYQTFAYGFTQCVSCLLSNICPNFANFQRLNLLVE